MTIYVIIEKDNEFTTPIIASKDKKLIDLMISYYNGKYETSDKEYYFIEIPLLEF